MKIIFVNQKHGGTRSLTLGVWARALLSVCMLGLPAGAASLAYLYLSEKTDQKPVDLLDTQSREVWARRIEEQSREIENTRKEAERKLAALTVRVSELQARLVRLDALGERLTTIANLENGEFDFSQRPAVGGPELEAHDDLYPPAPFIDVIGELADKIDNRQKQLETLEGLLNKKKIADETFIAGRPVKKGWMSSRFGRRNDPFTGRVAWHNGVDFAGKDGAEIIAVAGGVVTSSSERSGYGYMVEVSHGNGYKTRYAHCKKNLVSTGDVVKKGQVIALMGSTGRSTGPHVHFEVFKNGRPVDPAAYIHRVAR